MVLRYNHYRHDFELESSLGPGLTNAAVDERFAFSYGFQGDYKIHLHRNTRDGARAAEQPEGFTGLVPGIEYWCVIEEDPAVRPYIRTSTQPSKYQKNICKTKGGELSGL